MFRDVFEEQIFFITTRITLSDKATNEKSIGTGFIVKVPIINDPAISVVLLISNKHVFKNYKNKIEFSLHKRDIVDRNIPIIEEMINFSLKDFAELYYEHPDKDVDLACVNISSIDSNNAFYKNINIEMFSTCDEKELLPGNEVWFIGYPENRYDVIHNLPILRKGFIASIPHIDYNGKKQIVIDAQVFPGSSGSPVFTDIDGKYKLVGVVSETMIRNEKLHEVTTTVENQVQQIIGLGLIQKSILVKELIDYVIQERTDKLSRIVNNLTPAST